MITLVSGHVQYPSNLAVPLGTITLVLNCDATVIAAPYGLVMADIPIIFQFDVNGNIQANAQIWSNEELNPQNSNGFGTYYQVVFYDSNGARINKIPLTWQFTQTIGSTVDIGSQPAYDDGN